MKNKTCYRCLPFTYPLLVPPIHLRFTPAPHTHPPHLCPAPERRVHGGTQLLGRELRCSAHDEGLHRPCAGQGERGDSGSGKDRV